MATSPRFSLPRAPTSRDALAKSASPRSFSISMKRRCRTGRISRPTISASSRTVPAIDLFNAAKAKGVAVVFITGRRDRERQTTLWNLDRAGYEGWAKLVTRPDDDPHPTVEAYKTEERRKLAEAGYTIIATVGDQQSDLDGDFAECKFKVPNPFYFIR